MWHTPLWHSLQLNSAWTHRPRLFLELSGGMRLRILVYKGIGNYMTPRFAWSHFGILLERLAPLVEGFGCSCYSFRLVSFQHFKKFSTPGKSKVIHCVVKKICKHTPLFLPLSIDCVIWIFTWYVKESERVLCQAQESWAVHYPGACFLLISYT